MAKYAHSDIQDALLNAIKNAASKMMVVSSFSAADSYATVVANKLAEVNLSSSDFTITSSGATRVMTVGAKSATATVAASGTPDLHIAITDGTSKVLYVTDETSNVAVTIGATLNIPSFTISSPQPV